MPKISRINHIAILVDDLDKTSSFWRDALGLEIEQVQDNQAEKVRIAFIPIGGSEVELVQPATEDSGLAQYLQKRGPGLHHICFEVDDIEGMMKSLTEKGIMLINKEPRIAADGKKYAFVHPKSANGVMVELYQLPE